MSTAYYPMIGERVKLIGCYSEIMMHFGLSGKPIEACLVPTRSAMSFVAQIYKDGKPFSSPILTGEAGFYRDEKGYYCYPMEAQCEQKAVGDTDSLQRIA